MADMKWSPEDWARLGSQIRRSREERGLSRKKLSELSGISEKSIQLTEEGRVPTRWPKSLHVLEDALGWAPGSVLDVLDGIGVPYVALTSPASRRQLGDGTADYFDLARHGKSEAEDESSGSVEGDLKVGIPSLHGGGRGAGAGSVTSTAHPQVGFRDVELIQSGNLAQDTFVRQMKRYRKLKGISLERVAQVVGDLQGVAPPGGALGVNELERLENGTRLLKGAEAELISAALDTTVGWLLGSAFRSDVPDEMKVPPTDGELQAEAKALERRMADLGMRVNMAHGQYAEAKEREEAARQQAHLAQAILNQAVAEQRDMERQYQYLLGRIDSLRAAKGEELIMQVHPVYEHDEERSGEKPQQRPAHTASGDKAGVRYPGSKAEQEAAIQAAARRLL